MAATYVIAGTGVSFTEDNKSMLALYNGVGSGQVFRVYKIWCLNTQPSAVTGGFNIMGLYLTTSGDGGTQVTPLKLDSTSQNFDPTVIVSYNQSVTKSSLFRRFLWSTDEPLGMGLLTCDELETIPTLNVVWDVSYTDATVEPIVLREGKGLTLHCLTASFLVGTMDVFFEVTMAAT